MGRTAEALQKDWYNWLAHERRASPNTLRAYGDDVSRFLAFQRGHLGSAVGEKQLASLRTADIRAFIAARRGDGLSGGGIQRAFWPRALPVGVTPCGFTRCRICA